MLSKDAYSEAAGDWKLEAQHGKELGECYKAKDHI
jgi:hypothetical protein